MNVYDPNHEEFSRTAASPFALSFQTERWEWCMVMPPAGAGQCSDPERKFGAKPTGLKAYSTTSIWTTSGNLLFLSLNLSFFLYKQGQQCVNLLGLLNNPMINKQKALKSGSGT